jgi:hypothetical protein
MKQNYPVKTTIMSIFILILYSCASFGKPSQTYSMPPNVQQYFQDKYKNQVNEVQCDFQETQQGPKGHLSLKGRIDLNNEQFRVIADDDNTVRPLAKYFLQQESRILGIDDLNEWQDTLIIWTTDYSNKSAKNGTRGATITYSRYINGVKCLRPWIRMHITENDSITWLEAYLEPGSTEIYNATSKKTISEEEVTRIINHDLKSDKILSNITMAKYVIDSPPYVIWHSAISEVIDTWLEYDVNAFTGEIVSKRACSGWHQPREIQVIRDR